ncbi:MAG: phosphate-selective porin OprO and OprP [Verrucomicrobiota bacterium]|jgi:phosphate-selective porin OprO/OprP
MKTVPLVSRSPRIVWPSVLAVGLTAFSALTLRADDDSAETIKALRQRLEELDAKVRNLERKAGQDESPAEKAKPAPTVSIGQNGFVLGSADSNFVVRLKGVLQLDSRTFFDDNPSSSGNDGFLLRRARPIIEGTVFRDFDFQFVPDFAGSSAQIFDAWLNYRYRPELQLKLGKFKTPVGLEQLQSDPNVSFNERSLVTDLVPNRDLGVQLWGDVYGGVFSYALGIFNGVGDGRSTSNLDIDDNKSGAARLFLQPFKHTGIAPLQGLGFGVGGSYSEISSNAAGLPNNNGYATDGQQLFFAYTNGTVANGTQWRISPQASWYYGPVGLLGEYAISHQRVSRGLLARDIENRAWQVAGQWVLTGEDASFGNIVPRHPFDPRAGHWGAWQIVARYARLDVDDAAFPLFANPATSASSAEAWSVGLNWWLNRNVRILSSYSHTQFSGGGGPGTSPPATVTHQPEHALFTRVQLAF